MVTTVSAESPATLIVNASVIGETGAKPGAEPSIQDRIDQFVRAEMVSRRVPGVAIAIVNRGQVTTRGYGYANLEHRVPVTDETIFQSGSVGKMFTATAVMLLVEDGKLALSDPIMKFLPDAPET